MCRTSIKTFMESPTMQSHIPRAADVFHRMNLGKGSGAFHPSTARVLDNDRQHVLSSSPRFLADNLKIFRVSGCRSEIHFYFPSKISLWPKTLIFLPDTPATMMNHFRAHPINFQFVCVVN